MKKLTLILAMSSIVAYGQQKPMFGDKATTVHFGEYDSCDIPITFSQYNQPKYKSLSFKTSNGSAIERMGWGADSTLYMVLIDSNERKTTMRYKLIETK
jgi:hypothetical protein